MTTVGKAAVVTFLLGGTASAQEVKIVQPTVREVAEALGLTAHCRELSFDKPHYIRLVATSDDPQEKCISLRHPSRQFRVRVFVFTVPGRPSELQRVSYRVESAEGESQEQINHSMAGCGIMSSSSDKMMFTVAWQGKSRSDSLTIRLESSVHPFK